VVLCYKRLKMKHLFGTKKNPLNILLKSR